MEKYRPSPKQRAKIAAAECVLDYSARGGGIAVKVIDLDFAFAGLYYRSVVLISARALDLLDTDEFAAIMAHEVGHDYDWNDYRVAIQRDDVDRMRQLELKADGIAGTDASTRWDRYRATRFRSSEVDPLQPVTRCGPATGRERFSAGSGRSLRTPQRTGDVHSRSRSASLGRRLKTGDATLES